VSPSTITLPLGVKYSMRDIFYRVDYSLVNYRDGERVAVWHLKQKVVKAVQ